MKVPELVERVGDPDRGVFEEFMGTLGEEISSDGGTKSTFIAQIASVLEGSALSKRESDRRLQLIVERACLLESEIIEISGLAELARFSNALTSLLPPAKRQAVVRSSLTIQEEKAVQDILLTAGADLAGTPEILDAADFQSPFRSVLLLGSQVEHAHNVEFLRERSFLPLLIQPVRDLSGLVNSDVCGLVVGGSWWKQLSPADQLQRISDLCSLTSILYVRIDNRFLNESVAQELALVQHKTYGDIRSSIEFCHGATCDLTDADIPSLRRVADLLESSQNTSLYPAGVSDSEALVLRLAATKYVRRSNPYASTRLNNIGVRFLGGGRSNAKIAIIKPDDGGSPVVAKIDSLSRLQAEVQKYNNFISRWDNRARPELHVHFGGALLIYNLVESLDNPGEPAPTLEDRLGKLLNSELGNWGEVPPLGDDLVLAVQRAIKKIASLNVRTEQGTAMPLWQDWSIKQLYDKGIKWNIKDLHGRQVVIPDLVQKSREAVARLNGKAVVHGDIHLRNILVCGDQEPFLIDYAESGLGHPCYDLVRLDASILYRIFRMLDNEEEVGALLRAIMVDGCMFEEVERGFPGLIASVGNRVAVKVSIAARAACLGVLNKCGGNHLDYVAMHTLVACQALSMVETQAGVVRSVIKAIAT
jgi:hypothetical protein